MYGNVNHFISPLIYTYTYVYIHIKRQPPRGTKKSIKKKHKKEGKFARGKRLRRFSPRPIKRRFPFLSLFFFLLYFDTYTTNLPPVFFLPDFIVSAAFILLYLPIYTMYDLSHSLWKESYYIHITIL